MISSVSGTNKSSINVLFHCTIYYSVKALVNSEIINTLTLLKNSLLMLSPFYEILKDYGAGTRWFFIPGNASSNIDPSLNTVKRSINFTALRNTTLF